MEGTSGMDTSGAAYRFSGEPLRIPVGTAWLGRTCNGRGEPIDGGPPVTGAAAGVGQRRPAQPDATRGSRRSRC